MIRVLTGGRLGNQMFQLAFAHASARRLGTEYVYVRPPFKSAELGPPLWEYFDIGPWSKRRTRAARRLASIARHGRRAELVTIAQDDDPDAVVARLRDGVVYSGFFQSERWFAGYEDEVRDLFRIRPRHVEDYQRRYAEQAPYICMHVRRGDYLETGVWALPISYFLDALAAVPDRDAYEVVVVSDDPAGVRHELRDVADVRCEPNSALVDLQLLMHADVVITSNSSFSWWGAWLNRRPGARVIAPRHWLGFAGGRDEPMGVIPARWTTVPVRDAPLVSGAPMGRD